MASSFPSPTDIAGWWAWTFPELPENELLNQALATGTRFFCPGFSRCPHAPFLIRTQSSPSLATRVAEKKACRVFVDLVRSKDEEKARFGGMSLKDHRAFTAVLSAKSRLYPEAHRCAAAPVHVREVQRSVHTPLSFFCFHVIRPSLCFCYRPLQDVGCKRTAVDAFLAAVRPLMDEVVAATKAYAAMLETPDSELTAKQEAWRACAEETDRIASGLADPIRVPWQLRNVLLRKEGETTSEMSGGRIQLPTGGWAMEGTRTY
jgi:hypothetical protein